MVIIKCKMCGGDIDLAADKTFGTCDSCGNVMTFPKVDDDQRAAAFNRGNHFRRIGEFDKALAVYERIVRENDADAEAHWCCALCRFGIEYVEDPVTFEWIPTCHRASFDSFLEDVDYLAALDHSDGITRRQYQKDAAKIAEVQRGILATSQNAAPFDVFICYKESDANGNRTRDSLLAQDIYYQLTEQGRKVFFARITLEDIVGSQYEPYIFAALNSAKVMIVVGTNAEHLNAVWVKNEWSRFLAMMKKDHSKLLLPCYRDMDPYDMPEQLSVLQSYDMSKIGFLQDLIRGVAKVLDANKKPAPVQTNVVLQQPANSNVTALLKRGNLALEDGEWNKADEFFEEVLNQDAECAEAYLGKLMADIQVPKLVDLSESPQSFLHHKCYQYALRFAPPEQAEQLRKYAEENKLFLLRQGYQYLEEENWASATSHFEGVLSQDSEYAEAHLGLFLAKKRSRNLQEALDAEYHAMQKNVRTETRHTTANEANKSQWFAQAKESFGHILSEKHILTVYPSGFSYPSTSQYWAAQMEIVKNYLQENPPLLQAEHWANPGLKEAIQGQLHQWTETVSIMLRHAQAEDAQSEARCAAPDWAPLNDELARMTAEAEQTYAEKYTLLSAQMESTNDIWRLRNIATSFYEMQSYRDCLQRYAQCIEKMNHLKETQAQMSQQIHRRIAAGVCLHCGGEFKGLIVKKCVACGKPKNY